jgi:hypothetical protein
MPTKQSSIIVEITDHQPDGFKWIQLKRIVWRDPGGRQRVWESTERTSRAAEVDGVAVAARVVSAGQPDMILIVSQFRPPLGNICLEVSLRLPPLPVTLPKAASGARPSAKPTALGNLGRATALPDPEPEKPPPPLAAASGRAG